MAAKTTSKSPALRSLEATIGGPLTLGGLLRAIRQGENETLQLFAGRLGVSRGHLCDIEKGRRGVSVQRAAQWAEALGYGPTQFVRLALQEQVAAAGLALRVEVTRAA